MGTGEGHFAPGVRRATDAAAEPGRLRLDALLTELVDRAGEVLQTQGRLRGLLDAVVSIGENLTLSAVLQRIVSAACELVDARYGALGVLSADGRALSDFVTVGLTDDEVAAIGDLPEGLGILGVLIDNPDPLAVHQLSTDPRAHGFPPGHPPMSSFLGVPVRTRNHVFGNLYLADKADGRDFTDEDQQLVVALAAAAGAAIQNAQLFDAQQRRQSWLTAANELRAATLSGAGRAALVRSFVEEAKAAAGAAVVVLALPDDGDLTVAASSDPALVGVRLGPESVPAKALEQRAATVVEEADVAEALAGLPQENVAAVVRCVLAPLGLDESAQGLGVLMVCYTGGATRNLDIELDYIVGFAGQAGIALTLAQAQADRLRLVVLEDRDRIARDLHDLVIQRLFATGMTLQSVGPVIDDPTVRDRLSGVVDDLDATIRDLRHAIYELQTPTTEDDLRDEIQLAIDRATSDTGVKVMVHFSGPVASLVPDSVRPHLLAVVREGVSNAIRHAAAAAIDVTVAVADDLVLTIVDDGIGIDPAITRRSGLANLASRAAQLGGSMTVGQGPSGVGTVLAWSVPVTG